MFWYICWSPSQAVSEQMVYVVVIIKVNQWYTGLAWVNYYTLYHCQVAPIIVGSGLRQTHPCLICALQAISKTLINATTVES